MRSIWLRNPRATLRAWWHRPSLRARLARLETENQALMRGIALALNERERAMWGHITTIEGSLAVEILRIDALIALAGETNEGRAKRLAALIKEKMDACIGEVHATKVGEAIIGMWHGPVRDAAGTPVDVARAA